MTKIRLEDIGERKYKGNWKVLEAVKKWFRELPEKPINEKLHEATEFCDVEGVKFEIEHGANVNSQPYNDGLTPLHLAAEWGDVKVLKILLENGIYFSYNR